MKKKAALHLIQPMGGGGTRFKKTGEEMPKPLIELFGHPFFYWAVRSVEKFAEPLDITFVILKEHVERFGLDERIREYYPNAGICVIPHVLDGAVLTCMEAAKHIEDDMPLLFNDCDHSFLCNEFYDMVCGPRPGFDAALLTFDSQSPAFSYVSYDGSGRVSGTVEKQVVSRDAICGAYYFRDRELFGQLAGRYLETCSYKEYYISGLYNELVKTGGEVRVFHLDTHISFGTPDEYDEALSCTRLKELFG